MIDRGVGDERARLLARRHVGRGGAAALRAVAANGSPVSSAQDFQRLMLGRQVGSRFSVTVYRRGALVDVVAELAELDA